jgi:hypothetical protein
MADLLADLKNSKDDKPRESTDLLADLKEHGGVVATPWIPEDAGDGVQGVLVDLYHNPGDYIDATTQEFPQIPTLILLAADGEHYSVKGFHKVLRNEIEKRDPKVGDTVAVIYDGEKAAKQKGRKPTKLYRVAVRRADGSPI